jgi:hypothetical protein
MGSFLLSFASPESLSWAGFVGLIIALIGEAAIYVISKSWKTFHREAAFVFAVLAAGAYAIERVGDDAIIASLDRRAELAENKLADRKLSDSEIARIGAAVVPFAGQHFTMNTYWQDPEPTNFTKRIGEAALITIGYWQFMRPTSHLVGLVTGVTVDVADAADDKSHSAAEALVGALKAENVDAKLGNDQADKTMISITVGIKR